jgi:hypothetical protein
MLMMHTQDNPNHKLNALADEVMGEMQAHTHFALYIVSITVPKL